MTQLHICDRLDPDSGDPCKFTSKWKFNLDRHLERKHKDKANGGFIRYVVSDGGVLQKDRAGPSSIETPASACDGELALNSTQSQSQNSSSTTGFAARNQNQTQSTLSQSTPTTLSNTTTYKFAESINIITNIKPTALESVNAIPITGSPLKASQPHYHLETTFPSADSTPRPLDTGSTTGPSHESLRAGPKNAIVNVAGVPRSPWEERRDKTRKRLRESIEKETLLGYEVKRSKKWPLQQKAIGWITQAGKEHFDEYFTKLLARWGVKKTHQGTCILCPAAFASLDPLTLAGMFNAENCPLAWADGIVCTSSS
jgi:hypothetical protein